MICVSLKDKSYAALCGILERGEVEMAEIRLDDGRLNDDEIEALFSSYDIPLIATCRTAPDGDWNESFRKLELAAQAGAHYIDLEIDAPVGISKSVRELCRDNGVSLIRSYHNCTGIPAQNLLKQIIERCFRYGADIAKIAVLANNKGEILSLEKMYECFEPGRVVLFSMGGIGAQSRVDALKWGAPFTYAAYSGDDIVAPGQIPYKTMYEMVYGAGKAFRREGIRMPSSKSFAQRAIIAAALAEGTSVLKGYTPCDDSEAALAVAEALGAKITRGEDISIEGIGPLSAPLGLDSLDVRESGLLARLVIPLAAALNGKPLRINGTRTLLKRPLAGAADIMASFGVLLKGEKVPLDVVGTLIPGNAEVSGKDGSQLISGLLMALPLCGKDSKIFVTEPKSIPYMFITLDVMKKFGVTVGSQMEGDEALLDCQDWSACSQITFKSKASQTYKAAEFQIEADWSSAAFFMVAGAVFGSVSIKGMDCKSVQSDLSIIDVLVDAGACVSQIEEEDCICVNKAPLQAFSMDLNQAPDLFPICAVLACFCAGESCISGVGRLRGKESDRAAAVLEMLTKMGVEASIEGDDLRVRGESFSSRILNGRLLKGGKFSSYADHRIAMALSIASLGAESPIEIDDTGCVSKSFPEFFSVF